MFFHEACKRICIAGSLLAAIICVDAVAADEPWTVNTSIGVTYFHRGGANNWVLTQPGDVALFSADRKFFFFVQRRGDLDCDCNIFELKVYASAVVKRVIGQSSHIDPLRVFTLKSRYHKDYVIAGLDHARWLEDNRTIVFLGAAGDQLPQVHAYDVTTGQVNVLTDVSRGVTAFDVAGDSLIYRGIAERRQRTKLQTYPGTFIDPYDLGEIAGFGFDDIYREFAIYRGGAAKDLGPSSMDEAWLAFSISPNGRYAIGVRAVQDEPPAWKAYKPPTRPRTGIPMRYVMIDLEAGTAKPLLDAPTGSIAHVSAHNKALWSPDSTHAVVLGTLLPLGEPERTSTGYIIDYDVTSGQWHAVMPLPPSDRRIADIEWVVPGRSFALVRTYAVPGNADVQRKVMGVDHGKWIETSATGARAKLADELAVNIREGLNDPPAIFATYRGRELRLTSADPVVARARRAKVQLVEWKDKGGASWKGAITLPPTGPRDGRIALVIQPYDFVPDRFLPDGITTTAFAMQPLATRGMAVVQMPMPLVIENEGPLFVEAIDSAVEMAAERFGIDAEKVGVIGFSRGGGRTSYAITHPGRIKLAAAVVADGGDANYPNYLNYGVITPAMARLAQGSLEAINGGTFWANKNAWLERAPGFNLDRVETPVLYTAVTPFSFITVNEMYTGLRLLNKPVEVISYSEGAHQLVAPRERLMSLGTSVDWMSFWLQGYQDSDPAKSEQYARWTKLRALPQLRSE